MFINEGGPTWKQIKMLKQIPIIHDFFSNANPSKVDDSHCAWLNFVKVSLSVGSLKNIKPLQFIALHL